MNQETPEDKTFFEKERNRTRKYKKKKRKEKEEKRDVDYKKIEERIIASMMLESDNAKEKNNTLKKKT